MTCDRCTDLDTKGTSQIHTRIPNLSQPTPPPVTTSERTDLFGRPSVVTRGSLVGFGGELSLRHGVFDQSTQLAQGGAR